MKLSSRGDITRVVIPTVDQISLSIVNLLNIVLTARRLDVADFGLFLIVQALFGFGLGALRGGVVDPMMLRRESSSQIQSLRKRRVLVALLFGTGTALAATGISYFASAAARPAFLVFAAALPFVFAHEIYRHESLLTSQGLRALVPTAVWITTLLAIVIGLLGNEKLSIPPTVPWAIGAIVAVVVSSKRGAVLNGDTLTPDTSTIDRRLLVDFALYRGVGQLGVLLLGALAAAETVAAVQGGLVAVSPALTIVAGLRLPLLPKVLGAREPVRAGLAVAFGLQVVAVLLWGLLLLRLPAGAGDALLGGSWTTVRSTLALAVLLELLRSTFLMAIDLVRAFGSGRRMSALRVASSTLTQLAIVGGATIGSAGDALLLASLVQVGIAVVWWAEARRVTTG